MQTHPRHSRETASLVRRRLLLWLVIGAVVLAVAALAGGHAPPRIRLLGLFLIAWGAIGGWGLGSLARLLRLHFPGRVAVLGFLLLLAGQVGLAWESYRVYSQGPLKEVRLLQEQFRNDPSRAFVQQFREQQSQAAADDEEAAEMQRRFEAELERVERIRNEKLDEIRSRATFRAYLAHRVEAFGGWPAPWPALFWGMEALAGSILGAWIASRMAAAPWCDRCESWQTVGRIIPLRPAEVAKILPRLGIAADDLPAPGATVELELTGCYCADAVPRITVRIRDPQRGIRKLAVPPPDESHWRELRSRLGLAVDSAGSSSP